MLFRGHPSPLPLSKESIHLCYANRTEVFKYSESLSDMHYYGKLGGNGFKRLKLTYSSVLSTDANGVTPIPPATQMLTS